jgi:hypothetical protein
MAIRSAMVAAVAIATEMVVARQKRQWQQQQ